MATVTAAMAAITDHLRPIITTEYNPCAQKIVKQMKAALMPGAKAAGQKKEISAGQMHALTKRMKEAEKEEPCARRDACMITIAYYTMLRASEVARMDRKDIAITTERIRGAKVRVLRVFVNRLCKNDSERKGHERVVAEKKKGHKLCVLRMVEEYMEATKKEAKGDDPLFPTKDGKRMKADTPRGRLKHWLQQIDLQGKTAAEYGFHSLRAGSATDAAKAGIEERGIKGHGNWRSDAVRLYIRPDLEERLEVGERIGEYEEEEEEESEEGEDSEEETSESERDESEAESG
jgi:integrase